MDTQTRRDTETMAEWASTMDAYDRLLERRTRRRDTIRFWFNPLQVADEPTVTVPASEGETSSSLSSDAGSGAADSEDAAVSQTQGHRSNLVGPAGPPTVPVRPGTRRGPATPPHLPAPLCSRISAGITWT